MMKTKFLLSFLALIGLVFATPTTHAQTYQPSNRAPVADNTLGTQVSGTGNNFNITGGVSKGQTLFQSFTDFSVPTNGSANFSNPVGNRDIITRVTGNLFSDINGTVNSNGANFFLINPNGIVFGPNVQLNVGKAFVGSTANGIDLVDGSGRTITFGTNPNGDAPLLSIAPNVLFDVSRLNLSGGTGMISNFGRLQITEPNGYIGLIGGNVAIDGGRIYTLGGRVEIGGLSAPGSVSVSIEGNLPKLNFPTNVVRSDVAISNGADIDTVGVGGGDIIVTARNLAILGGSTVSAGIDSGLGTSKTVAGDITLQATGSIFIDSSSIGNGVRSNAAGTGGNITINTGFLSLTNGSNIATATFGKGNAGNIMVTAKNAVLFTDQSFVGSFVATGSIGNSGNIQIDTGSLSMGTGSLVLSQTFGQGTAGNVILTAKDAISLTDSSFVSSLVQTGAVGNGGNIAINTGVLSLRNKSQITTGTLGQGNAGNVTITVKDTVSLADLSILSSFVQTGAVGNGGNLKIDTGSLSLSNTSTIATPIYGRGNGGNIIVTAKDNIFFGSSLIGSTIQPGGVGKGGDIDIKAAALSIRDGSQLQTATYGASDSQPAGKGDAGNVNVKVTGSVDIVGSKNGNLSGVLTSVDLGTEGNGGSITVDAGSISFREGAGLVSDTNGKGNAGNVTVRSKDAAIFDSTAGITTRVLSRGTGKGGNITVDANSISFRDGAGLNSETFGQGDAGTIRVNARDAVFLSGESNLTRNAFLIYGGGFFVRSQSDTGAAGDLIITAPNITFDNDARITAQSSSGRGGNITIGTAPTSAQSKIDAPETNLLLLRRGATISTSAFGNDLPGSDGGNININSKLIVAIPNENSDITANAVKGKGGNVNINSQGLFGIQFRPQTTNNSDITASSDFGQSGTVNIDTPGTDPGKDSTELPKVPTDASNQISQVCGASNRQNKLTVTGRGGLPPNADDLLTPNIVWRDARATNSQPSISSVTTPAQAAPPAVGWLLDGKGKVTLVAAATNGQQTGTSVVCPQATK
jgi:filamentous hemagglutinin family protein